MIKKQFIDSRPSVKDLKLLYKTLSKFFQIPYGEGEFAEYSFNFNSFCTLYELNSMLTYNGLNVLDRLGIIQLSKHFGRKTKMKFIVSSESALNYFDKNPSFSIIGKTLLRLYGGIFELSTPINLDLVASKTGQSVTKIIAILKKMEHDQMIELDLQNTDASITFLVPREDDKAINRISKEVATFNKKKEQDVASVMRYIDNDKTCRSVQLLDYFGEKVRTQCGICSVCTAQQSIPSKKESTLISEQILRMLEESNYTSREMVESLNFSESKILKVIHQLMDIEKIGINTKNQYYLN